MSENIGRPIGLIGAMSPPDAAGSERAAVIFGFAATSLIYLYAAVSISARTPLWMDEVLAVLIAREPSVSALIADWWRGTDFSPPTYHLLLHGLSRIIGLGNDRLVWRLPSIAAVYGAGLCVYAMLSARLDRLAALVGFALVLDSSLFDFAVQARPYALLALGLAAALLVWTGYAQSGRPRLRAAGLWLILALCAALHFYGAMVIATIGVAELAWAVSRRQVRVPIWLALILTAPVELGLAPLFLHMASFNAQDNLAPAFYAKPSLGAFLYSLREAFVGGADHIPVFLISVGLVLAGAMLGVRARWAGREHPLPAARADLSSLAIGLLAVLALPFLTLALSLLVTRSYSARYICGFSLFPAIWLAVALNDAGRRRAIVLALMLVTNFALVGRASASDPLADIAALLRAARPDAPVVVGEGQLYIELMDDLGPDLGSRILFLKTPGGLSNPDPTNEHEATRLAEIHPNYRVDSFEPFVASHAEFYVLTRSGESMDAVTPALKAKGLIRTVAGRSGDATLWLAGR